MVAGLGVPIFRVFTGSVLLNCKLSTIKYDWVSFVKHIRAINL